MGLRIQQEVLRQPDALHGWDWAVWLEGERDDIAAVASVVYHLHPSYHDPVRVVRTRRNKFRICDSTLIEFMILARVIGQNAEEIELRHWLTLSDDAAHVSGEPPIIGKPQAILSYSLADASTALRLADALRHQQVEVKSPSELSSGEPWLRTLQEQVGRAAVVMLVSDKISPWAESEAETFVPRGGKVVPVLLPGREHAPLPPPLQEAQAISLASDDALDAVARQIREAITTADPPVAFSAEALARVG
jgi:transcription initiation factor IIF auxiliary subunit